MTKPRPSLGSRLLAISTILGLAALAAAGCRSRPLLSPEHERSQFDRYDRIRQEYEPQYVFDEFGRRRPNLAGRLLERD